MSNPLRRLLHRSRTASQIDDEMRVHLEIQVLDSRSNRGVCQ